jgi:ABC-type spermidine/putrescine transport system permease subunit I
MASGSVATAEAIRAAPAVQAGTTRRRATPWVLILPGLAITTLFLVVPLAYLTLLSFTRGATFFQTPEYTAENFRTIFVEQPYLIYTTIFQALGSTIIDLVFGFPFAYILIRRVHYRDLVRALMAFPLFGALYLSFGLSFIFLPNTPFGNLLVALGFNPVSFLYSTPTVLVALAISSFPFMIVNIATALQNVDVMLEEASAVLGASWWQTLTRILFPLTKAGMLAGSLLCFGWNMGVYIVPILLGTTDDQRVLAVSMYIRAVKQNDYGMAAAQGIVLMVLASIVTYVSLRYSRGALAD